MVTKINWTKLTADYASDKSLLIDLIEKRTMYDAQSVNKDAPLGQGLKNALNWIKSVVSSWGIDTKLHNNNVLTIELPGITSERIESVCHLDVVAPSGNWKFPPFEATIHNGNLYGRGTQDMKFQLWTNLISMKILKDRSLPLKRTVRLVIGTDEERSMNDIKAYINDEGLPQFAFTPDGAFPVCLGEKGVWTASIRQTVKTHIISIKTYQDSNIICDKVDVFIPQEDVNAVTSYLKK